MAMVTEVSASAHPPLHSFSLRTSFSSAKPHKFCKIDLFRRSKFTKVVCLATPYRERTDRAKKRGGELYDQFGRSLSDLVPRTAKARKVSREKYREEKRKHSASDAKEDPRKTHRILQVIRGKARGRKLLSPTGMDVRPMMEVVRRASFDIIQVSCGCPTSLLPGRWLDLYSGTGSVGIEAISRGCSEVHFVEMDPWVVENVLRPNLIHTEFEEQSVIHMARVEAFLGESAKTNCKLGSFDYISVTPPYQLVDYAVLMDQLSGSTLVGEDSFILVEYPQKTVMHDFCGPLVKIVDRRYGRTYLAVYGPEWSRRRRQLKTASE